VSESAIRHPLFNQGAPTAFLERLHPQRFCHVRDGFWQPMKGRGTCVEPAGESLPPRVEKGTHGVG
jgi:hypothetical protein